MFKVKNLGAGQQYPLQAGTIGHQEPYEAVHENEITTIIFVVTKMKAKLC